MSDKTTPTQGQVAGRDADATGANVARLEGMLAQEKAEYDNASRQLDKALEELKAERRRGDALLASLEATVPKGQTWTPELQAGRLMRERDAARADCRKETAYIESCELKLHNAGLSIDDGLLAAIGDVVDERDAARAEVERLEDALYEASREVRDHKSAREMAMTVVNQAWVDMAALSARAEKAEAEVERLNGAIDSHLQNLREIERGARELDAERMKSNACAEGLAAALRKIQNYTDETITCGWAREALEKFGGGK